MHALLAAGPSCALGEGPRWDGLLDRLLWVDIEGGNLMSAPLQGQVLGDVIVQHVGLTLGAVAPGLGGTILAAAHDRLTVISQGVPREESRPLVPPGHRFNDGAVDPAGRFVVGTLSLGEPTWDNMLLRLEVDGSITVIDDDLGLSNGLGWSTDGSLLYSVDTLRGTVFRRPYDVATGAVGERVPWATVTEGSPDGLWVDVEDHVWVAIWGSGAVHRYTPNGALVDVLALSAPHVSAVTFAGGAGDVLVVTTARSGLDWPERCRAPHSGRLFLGPSSVRGLTPTPWVPCPLPA